MRFKLHSSVCISSYEVERYKRILIKLSEFDNDTGCVFSISGDQA